VVQKGGEKRKQARNKVVRLISHEKKEGSMKTVVTVAVLSFLGLAMAGFGAEQVLFSMSDPVGDDYGPGTYRYPTFEVFTKGAFDITRVEISTDELDLIVKVQIAGELLNPWGAPKGFSIQMIDFYLDTAPGGSTETIFDTSIPPNLDRNPKGTINAVISEDSAWEFTFRIQGWVGDMFVPMAKEPEMTALLGKPYAVNLAFHLPPAPEGAPKYAKYEEVAEVLPDPATRTIVFKIPLAVIGKPTPEWKFVLYMAGVDWGNARIVLAEVGDWNFGGGRDDDSDPNIIDMLGPQEEILDYTRVSPVVLPGMPLIAKGG
jgi:carbohydrate-binding DOMON domain-containing protein